MASLVGEPWVATAGRSGPTAPVYRELALIVLTAGDGRCFDYSTWHVSASGDSADGLDRDALLDLLMSHCIEPAIRDWGMVFVTDFPLSQAALARTIEVAIRRLPRALSVYVEARVGQWLLGAI